MQPSGHSSWSTCTDSRSTTSPILKSSLSVFHIFGSLYLESNPLTIAAKDALLTLGPTISFFKIKVGFKQKTGKNTGFLLSWCYITLSHIHLMLVVNKISYCYLKEASHSLVHCILLDNILLMCLGYISYFHLLFMLRGVHTQLFHYPTFFALKYIHFIHIKWSRTCGFKKKIDPENFEKVQSLLISLFLLKSYIWQIREW